MHIEFVNVRNTRASLIKYHNLSVNIFLSKQIHYARRPLVIFKPYLK